MQKAKIWLKRALLWALMIPVVMVLQILGRVAGREVVQTTYFTPSASSSPAPDNSRQILHAKLLDASEQMMKSIPRRLDDATTLVAVAVHDLDFEYIHDVTLAPTQAQMQQLETYVRGKVCGSDMTKSMRQGVSYSYSYRGPAPRRTELGRFTISSCA